jgi:hypothetical protein
MPLIDIAFFAVTLFLALVALHGWKRRREVIQQKMDHGLREFIAHTPPAPQETEDAGDSLAVVR